MGRCICSMSYEEDVLPIKWHEITCFAATSHVVVLRDAEKVRVCLNMAGNPHLIVQIHAQMATSTNASFFLSLTSPHLWFVTLLVLWFDDFSLSWSCIQMHRKMTRHNSDSISGNCTLRSEFSMYRSRYPESHMSISSRVTWSVSPLNYGDASQYINFLGDIEFLETIWQPCYRDI